MKRVDTATSVAAWGGYAAGPNPDQHFTDGGAAVGDGTIPSAQWFEMVQEEIGGLLEDFGVVLSATDDTQLLTLLAARIKAIRNHATDTGGVTTTHTRAVVASTSGRATGADSLVAASNGGLATGADSAVLASGGSGGVASGAEAAVVAGKGTAAGARSLAAACGSGVVTTAGSSDAAVLASTGAATSGDATSNETLVAACALAGAGALEATGEQSAVIASAAAAGSDVRATGANAVVLASRAGGGAGLDCIASGDESLVAASGQALASGADSAVVACDVATASGDKALCAASDSGADAQGDSSVVLASGGGVTSGAYSAVMAGAGTASGVASAAIANSGAASAASGARALLAACNQGIVSGAESVLLASDEAELNTANAVAGGADGSAVDPFAATGANQGLTWRIDSATGTGHFEGGTDAGPADYAEMFPALAPAGPGELLSRTGTGVAPARAGERLCGVVSPTPALVLNAAGLAHHSRYARDEWGRKVRGVRARVSWPELHEERVRWHEVREQRVRWAALDRPAFDGAQAEVSGPVPADAVRYGVCLRERYVGPESTAPGPIPDDATRFERERRGGRVQACVQWPAQVEVRVQWPELRREAFDGSIADAPMPWPEDAERYEVVVREAFDGPVADAGDVPVDAKLHRRRTRDAFEGWLDRAPQPVPDDAVLTEREVLVRGEGYEPGREYVPRSDRPDEWTCVGLLGQLLVRVDASVEADAWVEASDVAGVGRKAKGPPKDGGARVECMEIVSAFDAGRGFAIAKCMVRP